MPIVLRTFHLSKPVLYSSGLVDIKGEVVKAPARCLVL